MPYIQLLSPLANLHDSRIRLYTVFKLGGCTAVLFLQNAILELSMPVALFLLIKLKIRFISWSAGAGLGKQYPIFLVGGLSPKEEKKRN